MTRRKFSREFKVEAVRLVRDRGVAVAQAARDLDVAESVLRRWMRELTATPATAFPGNGQSRAGNVWDNSAMESFFSTLKTERTACKVYRTRNEARADVFDYIERFYNAVRRHSTIGYISPVEFEKKVGLAY